MSDAECEEALRAGMLRMRGIMRLNEQSAVILDQLEWRAQQKIKEKMYERPV